MAEFYGTSSVGFVIEASTAVSRKYFHALLCGTRQKH
jgi:hypothetical protein